MANGCNVYGPNDKEGVSCCNKHDRQYVTGNVSKAEADKNLYLCVKAAGHPVKAVIMYIAVTIFGWPFWLKYRIRGKKNG